jgi:hypothetical protein
MATRAVGAQGWRSISGVTQNVLDRQIVCQNWQHEIGSAFEA